ncbi:MAG: PIN domain-containing protein [Actinomycetota bacterium]
MRALVDTNILVRHLTGDPPSQARRATGLLREADELILTDLILAELVYVMESFYERPRPEVATLARSLLALDSISVADHDVLLRSLDLYEAERLDFAEAYLAATAEISGIDKVASFDRRLDRVRTIERIEP